MDIGATEIITIITAILGVGTAITALTDTPKDDAIVAKLLKLVGTFSLLQHKDKIVDKDQPTLKAPIVSDIIKALKDK